MKKVYKLLRDKIDYYEFLNEPHWYIPTNGDQRDPQGKPYSGSNIVNDIAADQFYQGIDAIYEAEEEITGVPGAVPKVKLGGGADDSWGGDWGVLGTLFSPKYQKWFDRVNFVSIHKYDERPANPDDSNNGANSRNFKFWLRQKLGRDVPIFLNEYNVNTGQPHDETYGYKSVGWHGKNLIDLMTDGYAGAGYYTCYPADVPMDDYEASSGWIERGKGMYTWNNGAPYLANFTKTWGLMSVKLGLGNGPFKVKSTQIEGQMSQAVGAVTAEGNATAFLNNYSGQAYDNIKVKMKNVPYAEGTQVTASIYMLTSESDPHAAPATCTATVDGNGNVTVEVPEVASWGVAGIVLSGTQKPELDSTYEFESYQNTFHGAAKIEKSAKASNGRWVRGAAGEENAVSVPVQKAEDGSAMLDIHYMADKDSTLTYEINGNKKSIKLPAASDMQTVQIQENLKAGVNDITFYAADKGVTLDKAVVKNLDKKSLQQLVNQEFTKDGYTDKSWAVYEKAKEEAEAVLANSQATGEEVETAYKNLSDAISQLVLMVDLPSLITSAGEKQAADYTTESWVDFSWALQCAKAAAGSQDTAQEEQIKAYQDLDAAMKGLTEVKTDPNANVVQGLMPTSNVEIVRPEKATDGDTNASDSGDDFTQLEAGAETGGSDNGYANWQDVYLHYDLGAEYLINKVDVYRTFYEGGGPIKWKECKVEVSDDPQFMSSGSAPAAADTSQPPASGTAASASDASQPPASGTTVLAYNETLQTEAEQSTPQSIEPSTPVKARYLRVSGRGHQGSWGGYSNKVNFSEIQVFGSYVPDRSCLEGLIGNAEGLDEAAYTPTSWKTLTEKLDAAKKIGDSATLEQMNLAAQDLNTAIRSMKEKADSTKLKQAITNLNDLIQSADWGKLSPSDQETYMNLKDKAEKMANSGEASQAEMDKMVDEIANAAETLTASYDKAEAKEALELKIKEAEKMDLTGYSKESVGAFQNVLAEVKEILASEKAGAQEYRNAYSSLTDAIGGLVKESAGQDTPDGNKPDSGKPDAGKPDAGKPDTGKPDAGKPDTGKPDAGKPDTGKPDAGKPDTGKPDTGKPDTGKPDASKVNGNQTKDKSISTGDTAAVLSVCAAMILSVLIAGIALFRLKKRK